MDDTPSVRPARGKAFGSLVGAIMFGGLAWWLHDSWVVWPLGLLAAINGAIFVYRLFAKDEEAE